MSPSFWRLLTGSATSNLGDGVLYAAVPLLAATLTRDPVAISLISALAFLPWLLFAIPAGILVDRVDRRRAMTIANLLRAALVGVAVVLVATGTVTLPAVYVLSFLLGTVETVYDSAARAMLPAVASTAQLERGNSLLTVTESVGQIFLGSPLGALAFATLAVLPFAGTAGLYAVGGLVLIGMRGTFRPERVEETHWRADLREGISWLWRHRLLRSILLSSAVSGVAFSLISGIQVLYALETLGVSEAGYGVLAAATGVGAIGGALLAPRLSAMIGRIPAQIVSALGFPAAIGLLGLTRSPWVAGALMVVMGASMSVWNVLIMSVRQALIPERLFGRVQGAYRTVLWGGTPIGMLLGGALARLTSVPTTYLVSGVAGVLVTAWVIAVLRRHRDQIEAAFAVPD